MGRWLIFFCLLSGTSAWSQGDDNVLPETKSKSPGRNQLAAGAGLSHWPGFVTSQNPLDKLPNHAKNLRSGYHFSFDLARFNPSGFGIGAKYWGFRSKAEAVLTDNSVPNKPVDILARDEVAMHFAGIILMKRFAPLGAKRAITVSLFTGQTYFINEGSFTGDFTTRGSGGAVGGSLDFEGKWNKNLWFFARAGGVVGKMRNYDLRTPLQTVRVEPDREEYGSLNQIGFTAGFRFYW